MGIDDLVSGLYPRATARVYYDATHGSMPPTAIGDGVTMGGQSLPAPHTCALESTAADRAGSRAPVVWLFLPSDHG